MIKTFSTLYKKNNSGSLQYWQISVYEDSDHSIDWIIETEYGQLGTDSPQTTFDTISEGKNVGRSNETSVMGQAIAEAQAKHEKQRKRGYVDSLAAAEAGELDELIEGGIVPMLAFTFEKQGNKIKYPCYVQGKLDGLRMIAILKDGVCTLWSRSRKPITSLPHIIKEIEDNFKQDIILDGEAYSHRFKDNFEHIVHLVRQEEPDEKCTDVEYHIYDTVNDKAFDYRILLLTNKFSAPTTPNFKYLKLVDTHMVEEESQVPEWFEEFRSQGYEGAMLRNADGFYVHKRSSDLIKVKEMQDSEFEIIGIEEGRGKLAGHVGAFVCLTDDGQEFKAKMSGSTERLKEYFEDHSLWENKMLTVQFQDYTSYGIPRFPVGLRMRNPE
jgi:DNA ligase-1